MMVALDLKNALEKGDRRALARAITLVESGKPQDRLESFELLQALLPKTGKSLRVGISGAPGVGKSTFIEALGLYSIEKGKKVAVLAIDPSSSQSCGAILGDKTRMSKLGGHEDAFIRPSPSAGVLGGVTRHTREAIFLCEAAGFDLVIIETVGVGQLEADIIHMVDTAILLVSPLGGDHIQAMKKGVLEVVDMVLVSKADGPHKALAQQMLSVLRQAIDLGPQGPEPQIMTFSAKDGMNIPQVYSSLYPIPTNPEEGMRKQKKRDEQAKRWFWEKVEEFLLEALKAKLTSTHSQEFIERQLNQGALPPLLAHNLINSIL